MSAATTLPVRLGRYDIQEEIGRGMMGVVYRAHDPLLGREVALKTVHLVFAVSEAEKELFQKRFENEARVAALLSHPNIVVVHDVGRDPETDSLFIAFERLEGRTLAQVMADGQPLEWRRAASIAARVAEALHYAHGKDVVHRDVKPANIMILSSGEPKVMDFGVAKLPTAQLTGAGEFLGTPSYMSPEQAAADHVDGRSDVFSLGCVLYLMLTGRRAFDGASATAVLRQLAEVDPPAPSELRPDLPAGLDAVLRRALRKRPEERYRDARQLAEDLDALREGRPPVWATLQPGVDDTVDLTEPPVLEPLPVRGWGLHDLAVVLLAGASFAALVFALRAEGPMGSPYVAVSVPSPAVTAAPAAPVPVSTAPAVQPVPLEITVEHPFRQGRLRVFVDDRPVYTAVLTGRARRKLLVLRAHFGRSRGVVQVAPGTHLVRVEVTSEGFRSSRAVRGRFESGHPRELVARVGNAVKHELSLVWEGGA